MRTIQTSSVWYTLGYRFGIAAPLSDTAFLLYRTEKGKKQPPDLTAGEFNRSK